MRRLMIEDLLTRLADKFERVRARLEALGVPVKLVGLGEGPDDLAPFVPEAFVDAIVG